MEKKYSEKDIGKKKVAVINLLHDDGELQYSNVINDERHWVKKDGVQIVSHEREGAIYAIIQYYIMDIAKGEPEKALSPRKIIESIKLEEEEAYRKAVEEDEEEGT